MARVVTVAGIQPWPMILRAIWAAAWRREAESFYRRHLARLLESSVRSDGPPQDRAGRRLAMYEHGLSPFKGTLSLDALRDLLLSLAATSGMES